MAFDPIETHRNFARYNTWMNEKLLASCSTLRDEERKKPLPVPFGSLHGLWNHITVADNLWLSRFEKTPPTFEFRGLDMELYSDWDELKSARLALDERLTQFVSGFTPEWLEAELHWTPATSSTPRTCPNYLVLAHVWNHQTHHRGQITTTMELLGLDCGITDFLTLPGIVA